MNPSGKPALRRAMRAARRQLTRQQQRSAAEGLARRFRSLPCLIRARAVAVYFANDGELDPSPLVRWLWSSGKAVYLPVLHPLRPGELLFLAWQPDTVLTRNRFGIPEPARTHPRMRAAWTLDVIMTPVVGFDRHGHRLGMGGGFYDRTLARLFNRPGRVQPQIWGVAHDCQELVSLPCEPWDVPLRGVLTGTRVVENPGGE